MSRTVTALFDNRHEAEAAADRLRQSRIDADRIRIMDQNSQGFRTDRYSDREDRGIWASIKEMFLPDEDRYTYEEGVRRGGVVVSAQVDEDEANEAVRILEEANSVDLDRRTQDWRSSGWTGGFAGAGTGVSATDTRFGDSTSESRFSDRSGSVVDEERIPVIEEQLRVGKREVERGGARVRSYIVEQPVHEQVTLRDEHVSVERRPADETSRAGDIGDADLLRDRDIEMTETAEEAVVAKEAVVREEVVVRKTAEERVENIDDTVRRTEVEVDEGNRGTVSHGVDRDRDLERDRDRDDLAGNRRTDRDTSF
ncbi:YsnF/AvaK domain-containing protein [Rhizorhabdus argentea]|uniref:YsnF/AvaK domain-containing protein n=1 Tax=Rhizorhabdus argentea TaxID=1387174 RepID=UPI0030EEF89F